MVQTEYNGRLLKWDLKIPFIYSGEMPFGTFRPAELTKTIHKFENNCDGQLGSKGVKQQKQFIRLKPKPIKEVVMKTASNIYPNPADKFANFGSENINQIVVMDFNGKVVATYNGVGLKQINTSQLSNGVYIVKAIGTNGTQNNSKLIIQHK